MVGRSELDMLQRVGANNPQLVEHVRSLRLSHMDVLVGATDTVSLHRAQGAVGVLDTLLKRLGAKP